MSNPENDSILEQRSREAAEGFSVPVSSSWETMERELDKVLPVEKKRRRRVFFWWLIPGMLAAALITFSLFHENTNQDNNIQRSNKLSTDSKQGPRKAATKELSKSADAKPAPQLLTIQEQANGSQQNGPVEDKNVALVGLRKTTPRNRSLLKNGSSPISNSISSATLTTESNSLLKDAAARPIIDSPTIHPSLNTTKNELAVIRPTPDTGSNTIGSGIIQQKDSMTTTLTNQPEVKQQDSARQPNKARKSSFSFALVAGLDATTVKFRYADKANASGGILVGYHFNNNWSVHTGALFTRKNYTMAGNDFKAPAGSWIANYKLETVDGFCDMWEIPLLMRYTFHSKTKTNAFISTGLSSYLMTRENYNYFYYYNGLPVRRNANYPNGTSHFLSILKISGGWIRQTGKTASFAIEPFANLPLSGLGFGSVKLSSFGLNFSYQFRQPNKKK